MKPHLIFFTLILSSLYSFHNDCQARISNFETTRMKSTAGTGVASLLVEEAVLLNPASLTYFNLGTIYLQKTGGNLATDSEFQREERFKSEDLGAIIADTQKNLNGAIGYFKQSEKSDKKETIAAALSSQIGKKSSMGLNYARVKEDYQDSFNNKVSQSYNQFGIGITHVLNENWLVGLSGTDLLGAQEKDRRVFLGVQYSYQNLVTLMADAGADYKMDMKESNIVRGAIQIAILEDFLARVGAFDDRKLNATGTGFGLAWVQPKLKLEFSMNTYDYEENLLYGQKKGTAKETSFGLSFRF